MKRTLRQNAILISGVIAVGVGTFVALRPAHAQAPSVSYVRPEGPGEFHFQTKIGSFKVLGTEDKDVTGTLQFTCKGTVLISGVDTPPKTTGTFKLEYSYAPLKKYCYHGAGSIELNGSFRSVQWFGTDLTASFKGRAKIRLVGEFDKNLNTGTYWSTDPKKVEYWPANNVGEHLVPPMGLPDQGKIKVVPEVSAVK